MNQNWIVLHAICDALNEKLANWKFVDAFSNGPEELILAFENKAQWFAIKCHFLEGALYLSFLDDIPNPSSKALHWFKSGVGAKVKSFKPHGLDRSFKMECVSGETIVFKMYGRMSNVLFYKVKAKPIEMFRQRHSTDLECKLSEFPVPIQFTHHKDIKVFLAENRAIPMELGKHLLEVYSNDSIAFTPFVKEEIDKLSQTWALAPAKIGYELSLFGEEYSSVLEACNHLIRKHFPVYIAHQLKGKLLGGKEKELRKLEKQITALERNKTSISTKKSPKEIADVIMANLHQIDKGQTKVELFDFYENKTIEVKLNKNLSPQDNAAKYYKKSKSGGKELEELEKKLGQLVEKAKRLRQELKEIQTVEDLRQLRTYHKKEEKKNVGVQVSSPYWEFAVEGLRVLVGKSATSNDELLRMAKKDDWWFHAKDVAGSHCIVRNGGRPLTPIQLEKVGAIAAYYSKAKSQSIVPVIYTYKKFVRKPKGFPPGKVIVEKEEVVLVEPSKPEGLN